MIRFTKLWVGLLLTVYCAAALALRVFERSLVYVPGQRIVDRPAPELSLNQRMVRFRAPDSTSLSAWMIPAARAGPGAPWVLISHGNYGNIGFGGRPQFYAWFRDLGVNLFAYDYRGFGESEGVPSEAGLYADAEAAYRYLADSLGVPSSRIILFGHSLGTGVTIELARRVSAAGLIVEDAYTSVAERGQEVFPLLPVKLIARSRFASIDKVGTLAVPKLFLHGRNDRTIPVEHGRRVFAAAAEPKEWVELDAGHGDAYLVERSRYYGTIGRFIRRVVAPASVVADLERRPGTAP